MLKRNPHIAALPGAYLFPQITKRKLAFLADNPDADLINLGIGDTSQPIPQVVADAMSSYAQQLATPDGYSGYGPSEGWPDLREKVAESVYNSIVKGDEVYISDGAKCDAGRLQILFGNQCSIAVQDPSYPVYLDTAMIVGQSPILLMPCTPENDFFPDLSKTERTDLIYFCAPNNPTGAVPTREQLAQLVAFAQKNNSIIVYDAAYANFITDPDLPRSIFEIPGARTCAIEIGSFSKMAGFTGLRLGWTVIPSDLATLKTDWERIINTFFNGPSNIVQAGGLALLDNPHEVTRLAQYYLENAATLKQALPEATIYGAANAPFLWIHFPEKSSWDLFDHFLHEHHLITTPGVGFGSQGEHFLRLSAFATRSHIMEAAARLQPTTIPTTG